jgi:RNA polymerase sigma factor (sigma-70 family)
VETTEPSFIEDEEKALLQKMINELEPPKYGALIRAYFWEGKSYQELAAEYHTSTNTVGTWMRRAKAQLREKLS